MFHSYVQQETCGASIQNSIQVLGFVCRYRFVSLVDKCILTLQDNDMKNCIGPFLWNEIIVKNDQIS